MKGKHIALYCLLICLLMPSLTHAKIVFESYLRGLYVMDDDGSNVQRLTTLPGSWPVWSPDGKQIAFTAQPPGAPNWPQRSAIFIINSDGTEEYRLTNEDTFENYPTWSPDGKYIAFESDRLAKPGKAQTDIWRINLETKELQRLTGTEAWLAHPSWSPNGKYIAYEADADIFLMDADGRRHQALWPIGRMHARGRPNWSPDSRSVVYREYRRDPNGKFLTSKVVIHNININKRQILDTPDDWVIHSACFMGAKQMLIAASLWDEENPNRDKFDIYRYHLVTGEIVNLSNTPAVDDFVMDWISDDVLPVSAVGKKKMMWGELKE